MIKDTKYIVKRVIIGVLIALILGFINSCEVHAESYSVENTNTIARFYPSGTNSNLLWSTLYYNSNTNYVLSAWDFNMYMPATTTGNMLYNGRYLFSYYVFGVGAFRDLNCNEMSSNFKNVNKTTGSTVQNEITSKCIDIYRTMYHGYYAYRFLYEFTYTSRTGPDGIDELIFTFSSGYNPIVGGATGLNYGFEVNNISDYDINTINTWNTDKQQQTIINQNEQINNSINTSTQTIINQSTTNTNNIISNNNNNTNSIINNQNTNSQNEINAANQNTDRAIESQKSCTTKIVNRDSIQIDGATLNSSNGVATIGSQGTGNGVTKYYSIDENTIIKNVQTATGSLGFYMCFYNNNKLYISCINKSTYNGNENITIPTNAKYVRFTINKENNRPQFEISSCINGNQAITNSIEDMNSSIKDDSVDDPDEYFDEFEDLMADNGVITDLITLPISLYSKILNNINGSCTPFNLGQLLGTDLQFGCINIGNLIGSTLWNIIDILVSGMFVLIIAKRMIKVFENMTSMKESDDLE